MSLIDLYRDHAKWSQKTFGTDNVRGPLGPIRHLQKEAKELEAAPHDRMEYADALLLLLDASRRAGIGLADLIAAGKEKLAINQAREWPKGRPDQPVEHARTAIEARDEARDGDEYREETHLTPDGRRYCK